jgi:hypothetical protein
MGLLLRNICQFDFPGSWQTPIDALLQAAACLDPMSGSALLPERGLRALKALKQVLRGLQTKRFVADAATPGTREWGVWHDLVGFVARGGGSQWSEGRHSHVQPRVRSS